MSAAKDGPRDWDKELADIDKLIAGSPAPAPVPAKRGPAPAPAEPAGNRPPAAGNRQSAIGNRKDAALTWLWFTLALLLGAGLTFLWPYQNRCGNGLYAYLASIGLFGVASVWSTVWSWRTRSAVVHFLSIGLIGWAAFLGVREVLPRTGYARDALPVRCTAAAPIAAPAPAPPPAPGTTNP